MAAECLNNIVTLGVCPDDGGSTSGFTLLNAAGISLKKLSGITDGDSPSGVKMALDKKELAINRVKNDFFAALHSNNVITQMSIVQHETSKLGFGDSVGNYTGFRGVTLHKAKRRKGSLTKTKILAVQAYPLQSGSTTLKMEVFGSTATTAYTWPVTVVGNEINVFNLAEVPFIIPDDAETVRVTIDQNVIPFTTSPITCKTGCNGTVPNDCGWADGWNGSAAIKNEGYGVNVVFACECDYDRILCDLSKTFIGELIWLRWQIEIMEEQYKSDRFNWMVIYDREDLAMNIIPQLKKEYDNKWSALMGGALNILGSYRDDCLKCHGIRWKTNV